MSNTTLTLKPNLRDCGLLAPVVSLVETSHLKLDYDVAKVVVKTKVDDFENSYDKGRCILSSEVFDQLDCSLKMDGIKDHLLNVKTVENAVIIDPGYNLDKVLQVLTACQSLAKESFDSGVDRPLNRKNVAYATGSLGHADAQTMYNTIVGNIGLNELQMNNGCDEWCISKSNDEVFFFIKPMFEAGELEFVDRPPTFCTREGYFMYLAFVTSTTNPVERVKRVIRALGDEKDLFDVWYHQDTNEFFSHVNLIRKDACIETYLNGLYQVPVMILSWITDVMAKERQVINGEKFGNLPCRNASFGPRSTSYLLWRIRKLKIPALNSFIKHHAMLTYAPIPTIRLAKGEKFTDEAIFKHLLNTELVDMYPRSQEIIAHFVKNPDAPQVLRNGWKIAPMGSLAVDCERNLIERKAAKPKTNEFRGARTAPNAAAPFKSWKVSNGTYADAARGNRGRGGARGRGGRGRGRGRDWYQSSFDN